MRSYSLRERKIEIGTFRIHNSGYYTFELDNKEVIVFEAINNSILDQYNLKDKDLKGSKFEISYTELIDEMDDEEFLIFKLDKLEKL